MAKKKKHDTHIDETWLLPYSDMLTLLLALFIVLFAASTADTEKYKELAEIFKNEFSGGQGILEDSNSPVELPRQNEELGEKKESNEGKDQVEEEEEDVDEKAKEIERLENLQKEINEYIQQSEFKDVLGTKLTDEGLLILIYNDVFFDSGSAVVKGDGQTIAHEISSFLYTNPPHQIVVSGHTDNQPIHNSEFASNWELSVTRALNFMSILLENDKLDPSQFSAKGYGEHKPIAPNDTASDRAKNRRVEVLILPNY